MTKNPSKKLSSAQMFALTLCHAHGYLPVAGSRLLGGKRVTFATVASLISGGFLVESADPQLSSWAVVLSDGAQAAPDIRLNLKHMCAK